MSENVKPLKDSFTEVYVKDKTEGKDYVEVQPEYVYMTIPAEYVCVYNKILMFLSQYGMDMLYDCQAGCTKRNKSIINCFNMFNAAVAARKLGMTKEAETLIKYVSSQLNLINGEEVKTPNIAFPIDEDGYLKAMVSCGENPRFFIDTESGNLYKAFMDEKAEDKVYIIEDNQLKAKR